MRTHELTGKKDTQKKRRAPAVPSNEITMDAKEKAGVNYNVGRERERKDQKNRKYWDGKKVLGGHAGELMSLLKFWETKDNFLKKRVKVPMISRGFPGEKLQQRGEIKSRTCKKK